MTLSNPSLAPWPLLPASLHCNRAGLLHNGKRAEQQKWEKNGKIVENLPRLNMGKKWPKNTKKKWKIGPIFHFFRYFSAIFPHFRLGANFHDFPIFFPFLSFGPFSLCGRPARLQSLQKKKQKIIGRKQDYKKKCFPGGRRHININFLLWLTSRWPWDKRLVVPGLTGPKSLCVRLETQEILTFPSG